MIKFSDDTAILGLISGTSDVTTYKHEVQNFVQWCDKHFLSINPKKTVEMMFDPKSIGDHFTVVINGQNIVQGVFRLKMSALGSNSVCIFFVG